MLASAEFAVVGLASVGARENGIGRGDFDEAFSGVGVVGVVVGVVLFRELIKAPVDCVKQGELGREGVL